MGILRSILSIGLLTEAHGLRHIFHERLLKGRDGTLFTTPPK